MKIDPKTGLLNQAVYRPSPNFDERPLEITLDLIVIHGISLPPGVFGGDDVQDLFMNRLSLDKHAGYQDLANLKVSSHLFIRRTGQIIQFVPFTKRAWHAGKSVYKNRINCNDFSVGIELEGTDTLPYTASQYTQLSNVTMSLIQHYPTLQLEQIVGHSDIAPGRKSDPGAAFDWARYKLLLKNLLASKQNYSKNSY